MKPQLLPGTKFDDFLCGNSYGLLRPIWVSAYAGLPHLHLEDAEIAQFYRLTGLKSVADTVQDTLNEVSDGAMQQITTLVQPLNDVLFC
jgi:hypothetical protein